MKICECQSVNLVSLERWWVWNFINCLVILQPILINLQGIELSDGVLFSHLGMQKTRWGHTWCPEGGFHMVIITFVGNCVRRDPMIRQEWNWWSERPQISTGQGSANKWVASLVLETRNQPPVPSYWHPSKFAEQDTYCWLAVCFSSARSGEVECTSFAQVQNAFMVLHQACLPQRQQ